MLGRVFGAASAIAQAGVPVGAVLAGAVLLQAGLVPTIVGMGSVYLVSMLEMSLDPALRGMDAAPLSEVVAGPRKLDLEPTLAGTSRRAEVRRGTELR